MIKHSPAIAMVSVAGLALLGCNWTVGLVALIIVGVLVGALALWDDR